MHKNGTSDSEVPDIKIIIACHKKCEVPSDPVYFPVHVGAEGKDPIGFTPDNTGDNISTKNCMFSEMSGLYWAWKNLPCDYIGLAHYSRYLSRRNRIGNASLDEALTGEEIRQLVSKYRVILPRRRKYYVETIYSHYAYSRDSRQLDATRELILRKHAEYIPSFDKVMNRTWAHMFNIFIMERGLADSYCDWLFSFLPELENIINMDGMTAFDKRYIGAVSEMMLDVWLDRQIEIGRIKPEEIHEMPFVYTRKINWFRKITAFLAAKFFHKKYTQSF